MVRQFLVALLVLLGAGVSLGQAPVTYSEAGSEVVATSLAVSGDRVEEAVLAELQCSPGTAFEWVPVEWVTSENVSYVGQWRNECNRDFIADNVLRFYEGYCETNRRADCGRLKRGNRPFELETEAVTGTSLDDWWEFELVASSGWGFPMGPEPGEAGPGAQLNEFTCASDTDVYVWSSRSWEKTQGSPGVLYGVAWRLNDGPWFWASTGNSAGNVGVSASNNVESVCGGLPALRAWREGSFLNRAKGSVIPAEPRSDVVGGLRIVWSELLAENDRIGYAGLAIAGMVFDPAPTPEQLNQGEGVPGEGGGGDLDPGDCEEGWFLTQVVCVIREQGERLWSFISHDAWVPEEDWGAEFESVRTAAGGKFPFAMFAAESGMHFLNFNKEHSEAAACAAIDVRVPNPLGYPTSSITEELNLCDNAFGEWMHNNGRAALVLIMALLMVISLVQRIAGGVGL